MSTSSKSVPKKVSVATKKPVVKVAAKPVPKKIIKAAAKKVPLPASKSIVIPAKVVAPKAALTPAIKVAIEKPIKAKKVKLVRDSFTIPKPEYLILDNMKLRAADLKQPVKKSELIRAGIKALAAMNDANLLVALKAVPVLKSGRPSK